MELKLAKHFDDLATSAGNLPILKDQIIAGLRSGDLKNDDAKVILVQALDKMVSRKNVHPSVVQDAVRQVTQIVRDTKEVQKDGKDLKSKSMNAMIDFLSEHGIKKGPNDSASAFEPFSDDANQVRLAINTRMREASTSTSVPVRIRANELYERQWQSVLDVSDHRPALTRVSAKAKFDSLPSDPGFLTKDFLRTKLADSKESVDEIVNTYVQSIIDATKGDTLKSGDPRIESLKELTDSKYHDRIRMAAALALQNAPEKSTSNFTLRDIALNSDTAAYRHDAIRALERFGDKAHISDGSLLPAKERLVARILDAYQKTTPTDRERFKLEKLDQEKLSGKSNAELIKFCHDYIKQVTPDSKAELKHQAFELRQAVYEFGSVLTNIATMQGNYAKNEASFALQAEANFKDALLAFGIDDTKLAELSKPFKSGYTYRLHMPLDDWDKKNQEFHKMADAIAGDLLKIEIYDDVKKTDGNLELHTQELPSVILALNKYAQLNTQRFLNGEEKDGKKTFNTDKLDLTLGMIGLSDALTQRAYPKGTGSQAESYMQIARSYRMIAEANLKRSNTDFTGGFYSALKVYHEKADADLKEMRNMDPTNLNADAATSALHDEVFNTQLHRFTVETHKLAGLKGYALESQQQSLEKMSAELEKLNQGRATKDTAQGPFDMTRKYMIDGRRESDPAKKLVAYEKAHEQIQKAIKMSAATFGVDSPAFRNTLNRLIDLSKEANQPQWAEEMFKRGLDVAEKTGDGGLKLEMFRQQWNFYNRFQRKDDADKVAREFNLEKAKQERERAKRNE
jgi:hypothetical protein